ncbi:MAG TPA: hypothetical protein VF422_03650 [Dokdonella sp.]
MTIPAEWQLAAVVILIYLFDGLVLLHVNEAILEHGRNRRIRFGSVQPWIAGRRLLVLSPLRPFATAWRFGWGVRDTLEPPAGTDDARAVLDARAGVIARLAPFVGVVWVLVLLATPTALLAATIPAFVLVAACAWLSVWVLVARLASLRAELGLSWGAFGLVALECVVCPPVAANLPRKLSMRLSPPVDLMAFVDDRDRAAVHARLAADIEARLVFLEPGSPAAARAEHYRNLLLAAAPFRPEPADELE